MITIERVMNGYILTNLSDELDKPERFIFDEEKESIVDMLYEVLEYAGGCGTKHDLERIRIKVLTGDEQ